MSRFRRRLLLMMQKVQEIWRDVVLTGTGIIVATDTTEGQHVKIFPQGWTKQDGTPTPEIPVPILNAGTHNDETGKYEYTLTVSDAEENPTNTQTVTLTSDRPLTQWDRLVYMDGKWQWEYGGKIDKNVTASNRNMFPNGVSLYKDFQNGLYCYVVFNNLKEIGYQTSFCNKFKNVNGAYTIGDLWTYSDQPALKNQYFVTDISSVEEFVSWMDENPLEMVYKSSEKEYIPLQESEQQALNSLKTYYPTTVFSNDQEGFMQVEYRTKYGGDA